MEEKLESNMLMIRLIEAEEAVAEETQDSEAAEAEVTQDSEAVEVIQDLEVVEEGTEAQDLEAAEEGTEALALEEDQEVALEADKIAGTKGLMHLPMTVHGKGAAIQAQENGESLKNQETLVRKIEN